MIIYNSVWLRYKTCCRFCGNFCFLNTQIRLMYTSHTMTCKWLTLGSQWPINNLLWMRYGKHQPPPTPPQTTPPHPHPPIPSHSIGIRCSICCCHRTQAITKVSYGEFHVAQNFVLVQGYTDHIVIVITFCSFDTYNYFILNITIRRGYV